MFCLQQVKGDKSGYCRKILPCYGPPQLLKQTVASYGILQIVFTPKECGILYTQYTYLSPILREYCVFDSCLATSIHPFLDKGLGAIRAKIGPTSDVDKIFSKMYSQYVLFINTYS